MENITNKKEIIMVPSLLSESHDFHIRKTTRTGRSKVIIYVKVKGKKDTLRKCYKCEQSFTADSFTLNGTKNASGHSYLYQTCRTCYSKEIKDRRKVRKDARPPPARCECCNQKKDKLIYDHDHGILILRGFLCKKCNIGLGHFGDNLEGVLRGALYLEKDINKIIETLNGIKNERI